MIPIHAYAGRRVGVLGLGRSGLATARALKAGGAEPVCWDDDAAARETAAGEGFEIADLTREREVAALACLVVSPGIPQLYPAPHPAVVRARAAGVAVDNDVGLFFAEFLSREAEDEPEPKIVAVTGSNGKSTTTALIHHILKAAGRRTQIGGNIGRGVLDLDLPEAGEVAVLELSSYQIELARTLAPDIAVFLNLSPDHLERHGGIGGYFAAKRRLFELGSPARSVIGIDEPEGRQLASITAGVTGAPITVSVTTRLRGKGWSVFMHKNHLTEWRRGKQIAAIDLRPVPALRGAHNHQNACAAYAACRAVGLAPRQIEGGLLSFPGLAHRMERVGEAAGIVFVNDSKATNADAAEQALLAYDNIRWIAGGRPKAGGIEPLRPLFGKIAKAYLIGEAEADFAATLGATPHARCGTLAAAVAAARADARPGDVILLSPACASFDQFASFEARGEAFRALVAPSLAEEAGR